MAEFNWNLHNDYMEIGKHLKNDGKNLHKQEKKSKQNLNIYVNTGSSLYDINLFLW